MIIDVFTFTYNEELMVKMFLDHYSPIARKVKIFDNQSTDKTVEVAKGYKNVEVVEWNTGGMYNNRALTEKKNTCWRGSDADWVVVCDCDEFVLGLDKLDKVNKQVIEVVGYDVVSEEFPSSLGEMLSLPRVRESYKKQLVFKPTLNITFKTGHHRGSNISDVDFGSLEMIHTKLVGADRYDKKLEEYKDRMGKWFKHEKDKKIKSETPSYHKEKARGRDVVLTNLRMYGKRK